MSAPGLRIKLAGVRELRKALNGAYEERARAALRAGVYAMAQAAARRSLRLTPKLMGILRGSIFATLPQDRGRTRVECILGAGGPARKYAHAQHEGTNGRVVFRNYSTSGTGPKFFDLAIALVRASPQIFIKAAKFGWTTGSQAVAAAVPHDPNQGPKAPSGWRAVARRRRGKKR